MNLPEELGRDARLLSGEGLWEAPKGGAEDSLVGSKHGQRNARNGNPWWRNATKKLFSENRARTLAK
jgi:hypothetical protein